MKKRLVVTVLIGIMVFALTACGGVLGKWRIQEVIAGDITMTQEDVTEMGMDAGFVKLNKSGSCVVNILGDEYEGTWEGTEEALTINYGEGFSATASVTDGQMTMIDSQGAEYTLSK